MEFAQAVRKLTRLHLKKPTLPATESNHSKITSLVSNPNMERPTLTRPQYPCVGCRKTWESDADENDYTGIMTECCPDCSQIHIISI
jgi:hypothetical protein